MKKKILFLSIALCNSFIFAQTAYTDWKIYNSTNSPLDSYNRIFEVIEDNNGNYWMGIDDGIAKFDGINWTTYTTSNSNIYNRGLKLFFDGSNIWIGHLYGLSKFDGTNFTYYNLDKIFHSYFQGCNDIKDIDKDKQNNIWIATANGLVKYNGTTFIRYHNQNGLIGPNNKVWSVKCDTTQNLIWVGTFSSGLQKFNGVNFTQYSMPYSGWQQVNRIIIDNDGDIWVTGVGVVEFDKTTMNKKTVYTSQNGLGDPLVWGIAIDQNNKLWIGSDCLKGVFMHHNGTWTTYNELNSPIPQSTCYFGHHIYVNKHNTKIISIDLIGLVMYREGGIILGTKDNVKNDLEILTFPNPNNGTFNIKAPVEGIYSIINELGQKIQQIELNSSNNYCANVENLNSGIYFIIGYNKDSMLKQKIIVAK